MSLAPLLDAGPIVASHVRVGALVITGALTLLPGRVMHRVVLAS